MRETFMSSTDSNHAATGVVTGSGGGERVPTAAYADASEASRAVAHEIAELVRERAAQGKYAVLGLATGSTPTGVYGELVRLHQEEGLSLSNVISFNLDEYFPMAPHSLQSYHRFMREHLFDHVDIPESQIHIPDGSLSFEEIAHYCQAYEKAIEDAGGLDLQLLGIGRTGHIGFNEPGSSPESRTRLIWLDQLTRMDAASDFFGLENVPYRAITMGVGTILDARRVVLMAFGENKARIVQQAVEQPMNQTVAASFLQQHRDAQVVLDQAAAAELTRFKCPWLAGPVEWSEARIRAAIIWLARRVNKAILKLTDEDYNEHGLQGLLADHGPAYEINLRVFRQMQRTITGWPGGKPASAKQPGDVERKRDRIFPKRVLVFSPHPDDDVISMGGTLTRLIEHGHDVHMAYQVSGSIAVSDADTIRYADFVQNFSREFAIDEKRAAEFEDHIERFLKNKRPGDIDSDDVLKLKALIRRSEARAAGRYCGAPLENLHFLDMPFYETGTVRKKDLSDEDTALIERLLNEVQPHQVYAAGDLSDPHGTHRTCLRAIGRALERVANESWYQDCDVWLYRGAWQEWEPQDMEMAVPLSPDEVKRKRAAIFKHESQKDRALFPGPDPREFWQRAEDRNRSTAELYDALGLAEYEAIEGFVTWASARTDKV
jgi:glucosamine-6-phosphate deaminase